MNGILTDTSTSTLSETKINENKESTPHSHRTAEQESQHQIHFSVLFIFLRVGESNPSAEDEGGIF